LLQEQVQAGELEQPLELPGYEFEAKIGEGGMATVYRGRQLSLQRPVAIKVLNAQMQAHDQARRAFERESLIIARLNHPHIVQVIDRGVSELGVPFFVMEFIDGVDLARVLREGQISLTRKLEIVLQVAKAMAYAHKNGVLHRDIKPANIIVDHQMHVKVLDFGIAGFVRSVSSKKSRGFVQSPKSDVQPADELVMGTLAYMAPEVRASSRKASAQSDIYSLGVILFELLTGCLPDGTARPPSALAHDVSAEMDKLVLRCLHPHPGKRPQRAERVAERLLELLHGSHLDAKQAQRARETLGRKNFSLLDVWRENSFGAVYLFLEQSRRQRYVIKKATSAHQGYNMGRRLAGLEHPNLVGVHGASKSDSAFIVVMDYMPGGSLQERLIQPFEVEDFLPLARQMCNGLSFAHHNHVLHGNLRASNVLFDERDKLRLTDFGWPSHYPSGDSAEHSKPLKVNKASSKAQSAADCDPSLVFKGKRNWYQLPDEPLGVAADIYACGVLFYVMLVGELPRFRKEQLEVGRAFQRLPEALRELLTDMLKPEPDLRPATVDLVTQRLDRLNDSLQTRVWSIGEPPQPEVADKQKQVLLLLLLVLFMLVLIDTGMVALFEGWRPFDSPLLDDWFSP